MILKNIDEKILKYCGIYQQPEISDIQKKEVLKKKKDLEKITGMKIERVYIYGETYWGKDATDKTVTKQIGFLVDERIKRIDEIFHLVHEYAMQYTDTSILFWSLCQFEKRKQCIEETDYYISRYGALVYDSKKETEIDEKIYTTEYAAATKYFKETKSYIHSDKNGILMQNLIEIYIMKIGYHIESKELELNELIEYANYVSEDEKVKLIFTNYKKAKNEEERSEICKYFEEYINKIKQVSNLFKLQKEPTMKVYETKKDIVEKNGVLDIKTLNKEDLYIMYILQEKNTEEIARLYDVDSKKISSKKNNWNIKVREKIITSKYMKKMLKSINMSSKASLYLAIKKSGLLSFESCLYKILDFMKTGEVYLLKEFWRFTEFEKTEMEKSLISEKTTNWYRATLAMSFLEENELVEEVDFKKYKVTKKGRQLIRDAKSLYEYKIDLLFIVSMTNNANLFGVTYERKDIIEIENLSKQASIVKSLEKGIQDLRQNKIDIIQDNKLILNDKSKENNLNKEIDLLNNILHGKGKTQNILQEEKVYLLQNIINKLEVTEETNCKCQIKNYKSIRKRNANKDYKVNKQEMKKNKIELSDEMKSNLGIKGENYIFKCLKTKKEELLKSLGIKDYKSIIFYNIKYDESEVDKSIGHGCDIEIILKNEEHLYLEVKTSLDNTEFYTMTFNEYNCNIEQQDKYFILKINNFKYLNKDESKIIITIIKNPYKIFMKNTNILKNITFYTKY